MPDNPPQPLAGSDSKVFGIAIAIISSFVVLLGMTYVGAMIQTNCDDVGRLFVSAAQLSAGVPNADVQSVLAAITSVDVPRSCSTVTWDEYFRTGFLLLGGTLTTITGYYFGSRGVERAQNSAALALTQAAEAKEKAAKVVDDVDQALTAVNDAVSRVTEQADEAASTVNEQADDIQLPQ